MAPPGKGMCGTYGVRLVMVVLALGLSVYTLAPALYWHFVGGDGDVITKDACRPCACDCNLSSDVSTLTLTDTCKRSSNSQIHWGCCRRIKHHTCSVGKADCLRDDPEMKEERAKSQVKLLKEELKLQKEVNDEAQQRAELAYLEAKKIASQYQKEAEKCNMGMETSEEARERAEAEFVQERKRTELWEQRASSLGWKAKPEIHKQDSGLKTKTSNDKKASGTLKLQTRNLRVSQTTEADLSVKSLKRALEDL